MRHNEYYNRIKKNLQEKYYINTNILLSFVPTMTMPSSRNQLLKQIVGLKILIKNIRKKKTHPPLIQIFILSLLAQTVRDRLNNYSKTVISVGSALNPILP
jgi:hypothetical protein